MKKLVYPNQSEIFQKVVCQNGKFLRVRFIIVEKEGKLRGRVISCEPVEVLCGEGNTREERCLPARALLEAAPQGTTSFWRIVSPFSTLEFLTSIQIRAPARTNS